MLSAISLPEQVTFNHTMMVPVLVIDQHTELNFIVLADCNIKV